MKGERCAICIRTTRICTELPHPVPGRCSGLPRPLRRRKTCHGERSSRQRSAAGLAQAAAAGDEVVVGFLNDDPRQPVILGAMFSSKNAPPKDFSNLSEKNLEKGIVTRKGTKVGFIDDDKASLFIETAASRIRLDDKAQTIQISDQYGNTVTMDKDGIQLKSAKDLKIEASGNVEIKGMNVDVK